MKSLVGACLAFIAPLLLLTVACTGEIAVATERNDTENGPTANAPHSTAPKGTADCEGLAPDTVPLRRLSHVEYKNSVRDLLFGLNLPDMPELPPDTVEHGFENVAARLSAPALLVERYEETAIMAAEAAMGDPAIRDQILTCGSWQSAQEQAGCSDAFLITFGRRAFRRPLTADERADYLNFIDEMTREIDYEAAIELSIASMLQSSQFNYRIEPLRAGPPTAYELASRLSYFLWQSMPDDTLLVAAEQETLLQPGELKAQAQRMLADPRAEAAIVDFHRQWLNFDRILKEPKDSGTFPGWNNELLSAVRDEPNRFVANVVVNGEGTLEALLTDHRAWIDAPLADLYGVSADGPGSSVALPEHERSGILTRANFLAGHSHQVNASPVLRGAFINERFLCRELGAPPDDADTSPIEQDPSDGPKTNRMLFEERTARDECQACHVHIDGVGFGFEHYDALGAYRTEDNTLPVDATGALFGTDIDGDYTGAVELSARLATSQTVEQCVAKNWVRYSLGRAPTSADQCLVERSWLALRESGGRVEDLMLAIITSEEFSQGQQP